MTTPPAATTPSDAFFTRFQPASPLPPRKPFALQRGDRLLLVGASITEARRYALMLETYLSVCAPELEVEVRNIGKCGETAEGFLARIETECLSHRPTVATLGYGMNDSGYRNHNTAAVERFRNALAAVVETLQAAGVRVAMGAVTCIGQLPPWPFIAECGCTLDGINGTLLAIRNEAVALAQARGLPFCDHFWNLYRARLESERRYGRDYAVCGLDDGVHPSWAGHVVLAHGWLCTLGLDGNLGSLTIDLAARTGSGEGGHSFTPIAKEDVYGFVSARYPFCARGAPDKDWSVRSGLTLVPFDRDLNRLTLKVTGATAPRYRVDWMNQSAMLEEWHVYTREQLEQGINLAADFHQNPFSVVFHRVEDLIAQKQTIEAHEVWHGWEWEKKDPAAGLAEAEARRAELRQAIRREFKPVSHTIRIQPLS